MCVTVLTSTFGEIKILAGVDRGAMVAEKLVLLKQMTLRGI